MTRRNLLLATTTPPPTGLQFPVYLVEGDNGQLGIDVYNYLQIKYNPNNIFGTEASISELIYVNNKICSEIIFRGTTSCENIDLGFGFVMNKGHLELTPYGVIKYYLYSGGAD